MKARYSSQAYWCAIGVNDQTGPRLPALNGHLQGVENELGINPTADRPAYDTARVQIEHDGQIQPSLFGRKVRDIGNPSDIRLGYAEAPLEQVRRDRIGMRGHCRDTEGSPFLSRNLLEFHEPSDPLAADSQPCGFQFGMNHGAAVVAATVPMDRADLGTQRDIRLRSCTRDAFPPRIVSGLRHLKVAAQRCDRILRPVLIDERKPQRDSLAKKAAAFFKISLSSLTWSSSFCNERSPHRR